MPNDSKVLVPYSVLNTSSDQVTPLLYAGSGLTSIETNRAAKSIKEAEKPSRESLTGPSSSGRLKTQGSRDFNSQRTDGSAQDDDDIGSPGKLRRHYNIVLPESKIPEELKKFDEDAKKEQAIAFIHQGFNKSEIVIDDEKLQKLEKTIHQLKQVNTPRGMSDLIQDAEQILRLVKSGVAGYLAGGQDASWAHVVIGMSGEDKASFVKRLETTIDSVEMALRYMALHGLDNNEALSAPFPSENPINILEHIDDLEKAKEKAEDYAKVRAWQTYFNGKGQTFPDEFYDIFNRAAKMLKQVSQEAVQKFENVDVADVSKKVGELNKVITDIKLGEKEGKELQIPKTMLEAAEKFALDVERESQSIIKASRGQDGTSAAKKMQRRINVGIDGVRLSLEAMTALDKLGRQVKSDEIQDTDVINALKPAESKWLKSIRSHEMQAAGVIDALNEMESVLNAQAYTHKTLAKVGLKEWWEVPRKEFRNKAHEMDRVVFKMLATSRLAIDAKKNEYGQSDKPTSKTSLVDDVKEKKEEYITNIERFFNEKSAQAWQFGQALSLPFRKLESQPKKGLVHLADKIALTSEQRDDVQYRDHKVNSIARSVYWLYQQPALRVQYDFIPLLTTAQELKKAHPNEIAYYKDEYAKRLKEAGNAADYILVGINQFPLALETIIETHAFSLSDTDLSKLQNKIGELSELEVERLKIKHRLEVISALSFKGGSNKEADLEEVIHLTRKIARLGDELIKKVGNLSERETGKRLDPFSRRARVAKDWGMLAYKCAPESEVPTAESLRNHLKDNEMLEGVVPTNDPDGILFATRMHQEWLDAKGDKTIMPLSPAEYANQEKSFAEFIVKWGQSQVTRGAISATVNTGLDITSGLIVTLVKGSVKAGIKIAIASVKIPYKVHKAKQGLMPGEPYPLAAVGYVINQQMKKLGFKIAMGFVPRAVKVAAGGLTYLGAFSYNHYQSHLGQDDKKIKTRSWLESVMTELATTAIVAPTSLGAKTFIAKPIVEGIKDRKELAHIQSQLPSIRKDFLDYVGKVEDEYEERFNTWKETFKKDNEGKLDDNLIEEILAQADRDFPETKEAYLLNVRRQLSKDFDNQMKLLIAKGYPLEYESLFGEEQLKESADVEEEILTPSQAYPYIRIDGDEAFAESTMEILKGLQSTPSGREILERMNLYGVVIRQRITNEESGQPLIDPASRTLYFNPNDNTVGAPGAFSGQGAAEVRFTRGALRFLNDTDNQEPYFNDKTVENENRFRAEYSRQNPGVDVGQILYVQEPGVEYSLPYEEVENEDGTVIKKPIGGSYLGIEIEGTRTFFEATIQHFKTLQETEVGRQLLDRMRSNRIVVRYAGERGDKNLVREEGGRQFYVSSADVVENTIYFDPWNLLAASSPNELADRPFLYRDPSIALFHELRHIETHNNPVTITAHGRTIILGSDGEIEGNDDARKEMREMTEHLVSGVDFTDKNGKRWRFSNPVWMTRYAQTENGRSTNDYRRGFYKRRKEPVNLRTEYRGGAEHSDGDFGEVGFGWDREFHASRNRWIEKVKDILREQGVLGDGLALEELAYISPNYTSPEAQAEVIRQFRENGTGELAEFWDVYSEDIDFEFHDAIRNVPLPDGRIVEARYISEFIRQAGGVKSFARLAGLPEENLTPDKIRSIVRAAAYTRYYTSLNASNKEGCYRAAIIDTLLQVENDNSLSSEQRRLVKDFRVGMIGAVPISIDGKEASNAFLIPFHPGERKGILINLLAIPPQPLYTVVNTAADIPDSIVGNFNPSDREDVADKLRKIKDRHWTSLNFEHFLPDGADEDEEPEGRGLMPISIYKMPRELVTRTDKSLKLSGNLTETILPVIAKIRDQDVSSHDFIEEYLSFDNSVPSQISDPQSQRVYATSHINMASVYYDVHKTREQKLEHFNRIIGFFQQEQDADDESTAQLSASLLILATKIRDALQNNDEQTAEELCRNIYSLVKKRVDKFVQYNTLQEAESLFLNSDPGMRKLNALALHYLYSGQFTSSNPIRQFVHNFTPDGFLRRYFRRPVKFSGYHPEPWFEELSNADKYQPRHNWKSGHKDLEGFKTALAGKGYTGEFNEYYFDEVYVKLDTEVVYYPKGNAPFAASSSEVSRTDNRIYVYRGVSGKDILYSAATGQLVEVPYDDQGNPNAEIDIDLHMPTGRPDRVSSHFALSRDERVVHKEHMKVRGHVTVAKLLLPRKKIITGLEVIKGKRNDVVFPFSNSRHRGMARYTHFDAAKYYHEYREKKLGLPHQSYGRTDNGASLSGASTWSVDKGYAYESLVSLYDARLQNIPYMPIHADSDGVRNTVRGWLKEFVNGEKMAQIGTPFSPGNTNTLFIPLSRGDSSEYSGVMVNLVTGFVIPIPRNPVKLAELFSSDAFRIHFRDGVPGSEYEQARIDLTTPPKREVFERGGAGPNGMGHQYTVHISVHSLVHSIDDVEKDILYLSRMNEEDWNNRYFPLVQQSVQRYFQLIALGLIRPKASEVRKVLSVYKLAVENLAPRGTSSEIVPFGLSTDKLTRDRMAPELLKASVSKFDDEFDYSTTSHAEARMKEFLADASVSMRFIGYGLGVGLGIMFPGVGPGIIAGVVSTFLTSTSLRLVELGVTDSVEARNTLISGILEEMALAPIQEVGGVVLGKMFGGPFAKLGSALRKAFTQEAGEEALNKVSKEGFQKVISAFKSGFKNMVDNVPFSDWVRQTAVLMMASETMLAIEKAIDDDKLTGHLLWQLLNQVIVLGITSGAEGAALRQGTIPSRWEAAVTSQDPNALSTLVRESAEAMGMPTDTVNTLIEKIKSEGLSIKDMPGKSEISETLRQVSDPTNLETETIHGPNNKSYEIPVPGAYAKGQVKALIDFFEKSKLGDYSAELESSRTGEKTSSSKKREDADSKKREDADSKKREDADSAEITSDPNGTYTVKIGNSTEEFVVAKKSIILGRMPFENRHKGDGGDLIGYTHNFKGIEGSQALSFHASKDGYLTYPGVDNPLTAKEFVAHFHQDTGIDLRMGNGPIHLLSCYAKKSGLAQQLADLTGRDVIAYSNREVRLDAANLEDSTASVLGERRAFDPMRILRSEKFKQPSPRTFSPKQSNLDRGLSVDTSQPHDAFNTAETAGDISHATAVWLRDNRRSGEADNSQNYRVAMGLDSAQPSRVFNADEVNQSGFMVIGGEVDGAIQYHHVVYVHVTDSGTYLYQANSHSLSGALGEPMPIGDNAPTSVTKHKMDNKTIESFNQYFSNDESAVYTFIPASKMKQNAEGLIQAERNRLVKENSMAPRTAAKTESESLIEFAYKLGQSDSEAAQTLAKEARQLWLTGGVNKEALITLLSKAKEKLTSPDLIALSERLLSDAKADKQPRQYMDGLFNRRFDSEVAHELVKSPSPEALNTAEQVGTFLFNDFKRRMSVQSSSESDINNRLADLAQTIKDNPRPWFTRVPSVKAFYDSPSMSTFETMMKNVEDGYGVVKSAYLAQQLAIFKPMGFASQPWRAEADIFYTKYILDSRSTDTKTPTGVMLGGQTTTDYGTSLHYQPKGTKYDGFTEGKSVADSKVLRNKEPTAHDQNAIDNGMSVVSGASGTTNILVHLGRHIAKQDPSFSTKQMQLNTMTFVVFDGGHSFNESMSVYTALQENDPQASGEKLSNYHLDYRDLISLENEGRNTVENALNSAYEEVLEFYEREAYSSPRRAGATGESYTGSEGSVDKKGLTRPARPKVLRAVESRVEGNPAQVDLDSTSSSVKNSWDAIYDIEHDLKIYGDKKYNNLKNETRDGQPTSYLGSRPVAIENASDLRAIPEGHRLALVKQNSIHYAMLSGKHGNAYGVNDADRGEARFSKFVLNDELTFNSDGTVSFKSRPDEKYTLYLSSAEQTRSSGTGRGHRNRYSESTRLSDAFNRPGGTGTGHSGRGRPGFGPNSGANGGTGVLDAFNRPGGTGAGHSGRGRPGFGPNSGANGGTGVSDAFNRPGGTGAGHSGKGTPGLGLREGTRMSDAFNRPVSHDRKSVVLGANKQEVASAGHANEPIQLSKEDWDSIPNKVEIFGEDSEYFYEDFDGQIYKYEAADGEITYLGKQDGEYINLKNGQTWQPRHYNVVGPNAIKTWLTGDPATLYADTDKVIADRSAPYDNERLENIRNGFNQGHYLPPIDVRWDNGVFRVINGNHRLKVAREMGMESIPYRLIS